MLFSSRKVTSLSRIIVSINLQTTDARLIGLELIGSVLSPFFSIGVAFASFQMSGTFPEFKDLLNSIARGLPV